MKYFDSDKMTPELEVEQKLLLARKDTTLEIEYDGRRIRTKIFSKTDKKPEE
jgi:hypothetical protein